MCNQCSFICPHACIRPFLATDEQLKDAPESYVVKDAKLKGTEYKYRMQLSPLDCTGCGNCANICPAKNKALVMKPLEEVKDDIANWEFGVKLPIAKDVADAKNVKSSQFLQPLFEFSVEELPQFGFELSEVTRNLHENGPVGVMTDYEAKFHELGQPINRCVGTMVDWEEPEVPEDAEPAEETVEE